MIRTYLNGQVYEGQLKDNKRNGKGKMMYIDGVYEGEWKDNKIKSKVSIKKISGEKEICNFSLKTFYIIFT